SRHCNPTRDKHGNHHPITEASMTKATPEMIAELRRLDAEATPGPWEFDDEDEITIRQPEPRAAWKKDAALIVAMRNALPELLKAVEWQDISTAPELERVIVSGWQKPTRTCAGYWWVHEDVIMDGKPCDHPSALLWQPLPKRPTLPPHGG